MEAISLFNPFSSQYHALDQFSNLSLEQKIVTIAITLLATVASLFLATTAVFRALVGHFYVVIHPAKELNPEVLPGLLQNTDKPQILIQFEDKTKATTPIKKIVEGLPAKKTETQEPVKSDKAALPTPPPREEKSEVPAKLKRQVEKTRRRALSLDSSGFLDKIAERRAIDMAAHASLRVPQPILAKSPAQEDLAPAISTGVEIPHIDPVAEGNKTLSNLSLKADVADAILDKLSGISGIVEVEEDTTTLFEGSFLMFNEEQNQDQDEILEQLKGIAQTTVEEQKILNQAVREELEVYGDENDEEESLPTLPPEDGIDGEVVVKDTNISANNLFTSVIEKKQERDNLGLQENQCNMAGYIIRYLNDWASPDENATKLIQNTDPVVFEDGAIVKAGDSLSSLRAVHHFFHFLKETFGSDLAGKVFKRYGMFKQTAVTLKDIKKAMIAAASRVSESDLKMLFEHIRVDEPGALTSYRAGDLLYQIDKELYLKIKAKNSFDKLTTDEINFLHSAFRTVSFSQLGYKGLDVLFHIKKDFVPKNILDDAADNRDVMAKIRDTEITDYESFLFGKDIDALILMESWNNLDLTHPELALGEWIGKSLAYQELKPGLILPMPMIQTPETSDVSVPKLYKVAKSLPNKKDAVIAHVIAPLNEHQSIWPSKSDSNSEDVFLAFRGSMAGANVDSGMTWVRDFHYQGVGRVTYDAREKEIQDMVEEYLQETQRDDVTLRVTGHSLGACDCQRGLVSVLEKIAASEEGSPWRKVKRVVLTSFNAPKVNPTVNKRMKEAVRKINEKGIEVAIDVNHLRFYDSSHEDHVQWGGDILLGADYHGGTGEEVFRDAPNVKRTIVKVLMDEDKGLNDQGVLARHGNRTFNKALCNVPFRIETLSGHIETERLAMEKEMAGNYYWNEKEMTEGQKIIGNITWYASWFGLRQPGEVLRAVLINTPHQIALSVNRYTNSSVYELLDEARES